MKAELKIKRHILLEAIRAKDFQHEGEIPEDTVVDVWEAFIEEDTHYEYLNDFRESGVPSGVNGPGNNRHYESEEVARKLDDGSWIGWTFWHGGGKYGEPEEIDWIEDAYYLECVEEEKLVMVRIFTKAQPSSTPDSGP
jgi:hypothetical protein